MNCNSVVKKISQNKNSKAGRSLVILGLLLAVLLGASPAWSQSLRVGGSAEQVRVVFQLPYRLEPEIQKSAYQLIVNFSYMVGEKTSISDFFIIRQIDYDGRNAVINIKGDFEYKAFLLEDPFRYVIDIKSNVGGKRPCAFDNITYEARDSGVTATFSMLDGFWPTVRKSGNKVFLIFAGDLACDEVMNRIKNIPFLVFDGTIKVKDGTAYIFSSPEENTLLEVTPLKISQEIVITISTFEDMNPQDRLQIARKAFDDGDIAACIDLLEPQRLMLTPQELLLLGRAYWQTAYPYGDDGMIGEAVILFSDALDMLPAGEEKERLMLELSGMLILSARYSEALKYVRFLKESLDTAISAQANIQEIDILNRRSQFEDAFVTEKRRVKEFGENSIPDQLRPYYLITTADTYLGLNAYDRAKTRYNEALKLDPALFKKDPGLYARIADCEFKMQNFDRARTFYILAVNIGDPKQKAGYLVRLGDCLYQLGDRDRAIHMFAEVENLAPRTDSTVIAKLRTAKIMLERDLQDDGSLKDNTFYEIMDIYDTIEIPPDEMQGPLGAIVKIRRAQVYARHKDWDESFDAYYRAWIDTKKDNPVHSYAMAEAQTSMLDRIQYLYDKNQLQEIQELYQKYQESFLKEISQAEIIYIIANSLNELGDLENATLLFSQYLSTNGRNKDQALKFLFEIDLSQGNLNQAIKWNSLYLKNYPDGAQAAKMRFERGNLLYRLGQLEEAAQFIEPFTKGQDEYSLQNLEKLADIYRRLDDKDRESAVLNQIISMRTTLKSPVIESALFIRAGQYKSAGNPEAAQRLYRNLLEDYPDSDRKWWTKFELSGIAVQNGDTQLAKQLLNEVIGAETGPMLANAARTSLMNIDLGESIIEYNQRKNRFGGD